jgi:hypothetical protein
MMATSESKNDFFHTHGKAITSRQVPPNTFIPFIDQPQLQYLIDILARSNGHHAIIRANFSTTLYSYFIEAFALLQSQLPARLKNASILWLDLATISSNEINTILIDTTPSNQVMIIAIANASHAFFHDKLQPLLSLPQYRFILLSQSTDQLIQHIKNPQVQPLDLAAPTQKDLLSILKLKCPELEQYHQVTIPDEILTEAFQLTERYLAAGNPADKTLQFIESAAARMAHKEQMTNEARPLLTSHALIQVLSTWTSIPASHLQLKRFRLTDFTHHLHQRIFGQDVAINIIGHALQQAEANLQHRSGPFASFLFVGEEHCGKQSLALAVVEHLFKQLNTLHVAMPLTNDMKSITSIKLQRSFDKQILTCKEIIRQTPYAVIYINDIDKAPASIIDQLYQLLATGHLQDDQGESVDFSQAIIVLTTTVGSAHLSEMDNALETNEIQHPVDLLQLIMSAEKNINKPEELRFTPDELTDAIMPAIATCLPATLCELLHVVPFMPLNKSAIEKIICMKLKVLSKQLEAHYGVTLTYAPEVIHHLANGMTLANQTKHQRLDIEKMLRQLYFCIEHAIFNQTVTLNQPNQLVLQLNETGQLLRCDWVHRNTKEANSSHAKS